MAAIDTSDPQRPLYAANYPDALGNEWNGGSAFDPQSVNQIQASSGLECTIFVTQVRIQHSLMRQVVDADGPFAMFCRCVAFIGGWATIGHYLGIIGTAAGGVFGLVVFLRSRARL